MEDNKLLYACLFPLKPGRKRVIWEITNVCNASCDHCCTNSGPNRKVQNEMNADEIISRLDELKKDGINEVYFSGGEPMMKEHFLDILSYARQNFYNVTFSTNGILINEENARKIADINPDYVNVSIDSHLEDVHDDFRNFRGIWRASCNAVSMLSKHGVKTRIGHVITGFNYLHLEEMVKLSISLNADGVLFNHILPIGRAILHTYLSPDKDRLVEITKNIFELRRIYEFDREQINVMFRRFYGNELTPLENCMGGEYLFYITSDGKIGPCPVVSKIDNSFLEDSLRTKNLEEIKRSPAFSSFREIVNQRRHKTAECRSCTIKFDCGLGCPAVAYANDNSFFALDPLCIKY